MKQKYASMHEHTFGPAIVATLTATKQKPTRAKQQSISSYVTLLSLVNGLNIIIKNLLTVILMAVSFWQRSISMRIIDSGFAVTLSFSYTERYPNKSKQKRLVCTLSKQWPLSDRFSGEEIRRHIYRIRLVVCIWLKSSFWVIRGDNAYF